MKSNNSEQLGKSETYFLSDDSLLLYRNDIDTISLTDKLNLKCYVLYETKEFLPNYYGNVYYHH